jgi:hypothetical protein
MVSIKYRCSYLDAVGTLVLNYGTTNMAPTQKQQSLLLR